MSIVGAQNGTIHLNTFNGLLFLREFTTEISRA